MPETTPLIKAALNLRVGAGFDVYEDKEGCLNINVHEPRNAEFTAFLGSFLVV